MKKDITQKNTRKNSRRKIAKWLNYFVLFFLVLTFCSTTSFVQTKLGNYVTSKIKNNYDVAISVGKIDLSLFGKVSLKAVKIKDHHQDTLIYVNQLSTSLLSLKEVFNNTLLFDDVILDGVFVYMKKYKGEKKDNLAVFVENFTRNKNSIRKKKPFVLKADNIFANNLNYKLVNENKKKATIYGVLNANGNLQNVFLEGSSFSSKINGLSFVESYGLEVVNLTTDFKYTPTGMYLKDANLETNTSSIHANIFFDYKKGDLSDFLNKVKIRANFTKSKLGLTDIKNYYQEFNGKDIITFSGKLTGALNKFTINKIDLISEKGIQIKGVLDFENAVTVTNGFRFKGDFTKAEATYKTLKNTLPNVLGKTLPSEFEKLGKFNMVGEVDATLDKVATDITIYSEIGVLATNLKIEHIKPIDNISYVGNVELINFDIGKFFENPLFGKTNIKGFVNGNGFKLENINTAFNGTIANLNFKNYTYNNIVANGKYSNNKFDGFLSVNDRNFKMNFEGLADLSSTIHEFNFNTTIEYLDLKATNLFTKDSIAKLKGSISLDIKGNSLDNITGDAIFKDIVYTNEKKEFVFDEFIVKSSLNDTFKKIEVISNDIVTGTISGDFLFQELPQVTQNALGSMFENYKPYEVSPNQYVDYNFSVYDQIVNVFFPDITIDNQTKITGRIDANKSLFRLNFSSPKLEIYDNEIKEVSIVTETQNQLHYTSLTLDEIKTKYYSLSELNLTNSNTNDTLYFKSVFKGKQKKNETFNVDFFFTFNEEGNSVVGFQKSTFNFKGNVWNIIPNQLNTAQITFNLKKELFEFSQFKLTSGKQEVSFLGKLKGSTEKKIALQFEKVELESFLPEIDSLSLKGKLSGALDFVQKNTNYKPKASFVIEDFEINKFKQGDLNLNIKGNNSYKYYDVNMAIKNDLVKSFIAVGNLDFTEKQPLMDLKVYLEDFDLRAYSPLGKDVLSSIRGTASGDLFVRGFIGNPEVNGTLYLYNSGLKFPYLNVDYNFAEETIISLDDQSILFDKIQLSNSEYGTKGTLSGAITHLNFEQWFLNLQIESDNLVVLNTENSEESLYYGTAFIDGNASITGLTDQLTIDVNAKTMPGTVFVVPLKDIETVSSYNLIHFKSNKSEVEALQEEIAIEAIKGVSLNIDLEVTKEAIAQVVIDEVNGSQLSGSGTGNLRIEINTRGKFNMFGDYTIEQGVYDFKYGGVIDKPFVIQKGGAVSWSGSPYEANLDVTAIHKVKANPAVLLDNFNSNRKIEVDLVTRITGGLFSSKQDLDIELNNVDPTIANELEFVLNDNNINERTTQFISLLAFGYFRDVNNSNFNANNAIAGTASSALGAAFSNLVNSGDSKFQLGVDYQQGSTDNDVERLNIDNQVDVSVSTQLSDRILINGKVGVPVGAQAQSSVVGEVKIEVLLNDEGNFRTIIFNRQNEIQYSTQEEGYTQGVGLNYQVNFNTFSELLRKLGIKKNRKGPAVEKDNRNKQATVEK